MNFRLSPCLLASLVLQGACGPGSKVDDDGSVGDDSAADQDFDNDGFEWGIDCDDEDAAVHPGATEVCDGIDNNCDGTVDEPGAVGGQTWNADADVDGFGDPEVELEACTRPAGFVSDDGDCDDADPDIHPGAADTWYDGVDSDCGGGSDYDADADGFDRQDDGGMDCDDARPDVNPNATEVCNDGLDNDCDGSAGSCALESELTSRDADAAWLGEEHADMAGSTLADVGDLDGDGRTDLLIGAPYAADSVGDSSTGTMYLFTETHNGDLSVDDATARVMQVQPCAEWSPWSAAGAGDIDGDGYRDLVLGSCDYWIDGFGGPVYLGATHIVYGPFVGNQGAITDGLTISGEQGGDLAGVAVDGGSDLTGDGLPDLVVGAAGNDYAARNAGIVYLLDGSALPDTNLARGDIRLVGAAADDRFGEPVVMAGDLNGDGIEDVAVGAYGHDSDAGVGYAFIGPFSGTTSAQDAELQVGGANVGAWMGWPVAPAGDLDADGYADLAMGACGDSTHAEKAGAVYVMPGGSRLSSSLDDAVVSVFGEQANGFVGAEVSAGGDIDGDGADDLLVGAPWQDFAGLESAGATYVYYGTLGGTLLTSDADVRLGGTRGSAELGGQLVGADLDGDGLSDIVIGSVGDRTEGDYAGAAFLFLGRGL